MYEPEKQEERRDKEYERLRQDNLNLKNTLEQEKV